MTAATIVVCLVQRAKGEAVVGVWCDCDWDRRRG
jgi:hypothetical protein